MDYTRELLAQLARQERLANGYQIARFLGVNKQTAYRYLDGRSTLDDWRGLLVADALGLDRAVVICRLHAARSDCPSAGSALLDAAERITASHSIA